MFDGGLRKLTTARYAALYNADVAGYKQTVLVALQQTEDSLASLGLLTRQIEQQQETVASA
jgi:outer membrane protein TolC